MSSRPRPTIPERIPLDQLAPLVLCRARAVHAESVARAVRESLAHLRPWMPWAAGEDSADPEFQRRRLLEVESAWDRGDEFGFVLTAATADEVFGAFGLMTRRGPGVLEIGYWVHADVGGRGVATSAARALTRVALAESDVDCVAIVCDAANVRSAAIPRALGYRLESVHPRPASAPADSGREMVWVRRKGV